MDEDKKVITVTWDQLEGDGYPSVTDFCRYLVSTGGKFEGIRIEVYRDDMLCLTVHDIYKAAKLEPTDGGWRKYRTPEEKYPNRHWPEPQGAI